MSADDLELEFPRLAAHGYAITSDPGDVPNCIAWVMRDAGHYWDPQLTGFRGIYYWPPGVPRDDSLEAWTKLFELFGYRECENADPEVNAEKVAIYADSEGIPHHVARQLPSGVWTSKLGQSEDIEHRTLDALSDGIYGNVVKLMRRQIR